MVRSSVTTMATSASSSGTDPWSSSAGLIEDGDDCADINWEEEEEDILLIPKLEPVDDTDIKDLSPLSPETPSPTTMKITTVAISPTCIKRPRGRPRKHPKPSLESLNKVTKGRSKTGCITCRKRKKKCDETKPGCMNCEKNSVTCEGYPAKTIWKSGKEKKAEEARLCGAGSISLSTLQLPFLVHGLETEGDRIFLRHYITTLSIKFTMEGENDNAFRSILLPMAQQHAGLMHSILALSSKHIDYQSPYGQKILQDHPSESIDSLQKRSVFHQEEALKELISQKCGEKVAPATFAQMICRVLETLSDPHPNGQHRFHLQHYRNLVHEHPLENSCEMKFIHEFFQYHISADDLIYLPPSDMHCISATEDWNLPTTVLQPSAVRLLGVFDGLFLYMSKITTIRNKVRENIDQGIEPIVDFESFYAAAEIDAGIRQWRPAWPRGDPRDVAGMLYRQMVWIYLWRTIYPPQSTNWVLDPHITLAVNDGIDLLQQFGPQDPSQTLLLAPAFVIGCAAFAPKQREPIRQAIKIIKNYMEYRNTDTAMGVLEEVWRMMDAQDERSWDWQNIAHKMGMDFLAT